MEKGEMEGDGSKKTGEREREKLKWLKMEPEFYFIR